MVLWAYRCFCKLALVGYVCIFCDFGALVLPGFCSTVCRYLELCRYAIRTLPSNSYVVATEQEAVTFCSLRECVPFALAKLKFSLQAIHMMYHPFTEPLPKELYELVSVVQPLDQPFAPKHLIMKGIPGSILAFTYASLHVVLGIFSLTQYSVEHALKLAGAHLQHFFLSIELRIVAICW